MACYNLTLRTSKLNSIFISFERQAIQNNRKARLVEKCQKAIKLRRRQF
jgi:hypothetical protein